MEWSEFYEQQAGRGVRPTFTAALQAWRDARGDEVGAAVDLGCGDGTETRALLAQGWRVLAIDADAGVIGRVTGGTTQAERERLTVRRATYARLVPETAPVELPRADLVYAGFALPFCAPEVFERLWSGIRGSLRPSGLIAGELFGPNDDFASWPEMNTHDRADVDRLLTGLEVLALREDERDGTSFAGPKHWHVFHLVARRR